MTKVNFFNKHLVEAGEGYLEHFIFAAVTSLWIVMAGIILMFHAIFPCILTTATSDNIKKINERMQKRVMVLTERRNKKNLAK
ncbi:MAG: hypothetical protein EXR06_03075 [Rickettsiales bacterium]|nr:hypothetical protein [Rickettsiales bacterium]